MILEVFPALLILEFYDHMYNRSLTHQWEYYRQMKRGVGCVAWNTSSLWWGASRPSQTSPEVSIGSFEGTSNTQMSKIIRAGPCEASNGGKNRYKTFKPNPQVFCTTEEGTWVSTWACKPHFLISCPTHTLSIALPGRITKKLDSHHKHDNSKMFKTLKWTCPFIWRKIIF